MEAVSILEGLSYQPKFPSLPIILFTFIAILTGIWKFRVSVARRKNLPPGNLGLPLIGESISFIQAHKHNKIPDWVEKRRSKHGPIFKTSIMGSNMMFVTGEPGNRFMLSGRENGIASCLPTTAIAILGKNNVFNLSGSRHKLVRGGIMSILNPERIQRYVSQMDSLAKQQLFQELNDKECVQVVPLMKKITFTVTCNLLFGLPEGKEKDALFEEFTIAVKGTWSIPLNFPGTTFQKALQARGRICRLFSNLIARKKKGLEDGNLDSNEDIILALLNLRDENGKPIPEEEIISNLIAIVIASHDTTTVLLSLIIRQVARDANVYNKVLEEQNEVVKARAANGGKLNWREVQKIRYTWNVAQELMRLTPPIMGNYRCAWRDTTFNGYDIPKGWQLFWVATGTHLDKQIFEDPKTFDPSRFEILSKSFPPYTFVPFGAGPRICPGAEFARIEVLLIIHHMITTYRWTEVFPDEPMINDPMPYPAKGLPIKLYPRNTQ